MSDVCVWLVVLESNVWVMVSTEGPEEHIIIVRPNHGTYMEN